MLGSSQPRYLNLRVRRPASVWPLARALSLGAVGAIVALLLTRPELGLLVFWGLLIPALPVTFVLAPGLWRNVCPMATANQLPRVLGITRARTLPPWLERHGYGVGVVLFFGLILSRPTLLERSGAAVALLLGTVLVTPFVAGLFFKGKSGFCGSICPLRPVQGLYARAPVVKVANSHCRPCVGCTTNCQDLKPTTALLDDLHDRDPLRGGYRRVFAGVLPGFTYAFFTLPVDRLAPPEVLLRASVAMLAGVGLLSALGALVRLTAGQLSALAGAASLGIFYWFNVAVVAGAVGELIGARAQPWAVWEGRGVVCALIAGWLVRSLRAASAERRDAPAEPELASAPAQAAPEPTGLALPVIQSGVAVPAAPAVAGDPPVPIPDRRSHGRPMRRPTVTLWPEGRQVEVESGSSLVIAMQAAGVEPPKGCGTGLCGADPVYVLAGVANLSPAGPDEQSTLARMGLPEHARLACSTRVLDDVTISQSAHARRPQEPAAAPERAPVPVRVSPPAAGIERVVIIGNGVAGVTAAGHIRRLASDCKIDLISDSPHPFYNRIAIARLVHEPTGLQGLQLMPEPWYGEQRITQWLNTRVAGIDRDSNEILLGTGETLPYDRLVLATGARAAIPPMAGVDRDGVFPLRRAEDALRIRAYVQDHGCRRAVVIGGGLLGLEAADAVAKLGLEVTVVERDAWLGHRELDARSAELLQEHLHAGGMDTRIGAAVRAITGAERADGVELVGGEVLDADLVLVCAGITPNVNLAREAGLSVARGVVVDAHMRTSDAQIVACGDAAEFEGALYGRWATAVVQAEVAAVSAVGGQRVYEPAPMPTKLKLSGIALVSIGRKDGVTDDEEIVDDTAGRYRKLVLSKGRVAGALALGGAADHDQLADAVRRGLDVSHGLEALRGGDWSPLGLDGALPPDKPKAKVRPRGRSRRVA